jgi:hypothetical protein
LKCGSLTFSSAHVIPQIALARTSTSVRVGLVLAGVGAKRKLNVYQKEEKA